MANPYGYNRPTFASLTDSINTFRRKVNQIGNDLGDKFRLTEHFRTDSDVVGVLLELDYRINEVDSDLELRVGGLGKDTGNLYIVNGKKGDYIHMQLTYDSAAKTVDLIFPNGDATLDAHGDIILSANGNNLFIDDGSTTRFAYTLGSNNILNVTGNLENNISGSLKDSAGTSYTLVTGTTYDAITGGNHSTNVGGNLSLLVDGSVFDSAGTTYTHVVGTTFNETVGSNYTQVINGTHTQTVNGGAYQTNVTNGDYTIDVSGDMVLDVDGDNLTFKNGTGGTRFAYTLGAANTLAVTGSLTENISSSITRNATTTHELTGTNITLDASDQIYLEADGDIIHLRSITADRFKFLTDATPSLEINGGFNLTGNSYVITQSGTYMRDSASTNYTLTANSNILQKSGGTFTQTSGGNFATNVTGTYTATVSSNVLIDAGGDITLDADGNDIVFKNGGGNDTVTHTLANDATYKITAPSTYTVDAGGDINIDAGGNTVNINGDGTTRISHELGTSNVTTVTGNYEQNVTGNLIDSAAGTHSTISNGAMNLTSGGDFTTTVTGNVLVDASGDITLDADGDNITFKNGAGGNRFAYTLGASNVLDITGNYTQNVSGAQVDSAGTSYSLVAGTTISQTSGGDYSTNVGGNYTLGVDGSISSTAGTTITYTSGDDYTVNVGGNALFDVVGDITLDAGGGNVFIKDDDTTQFEFIAGTNKEIDVPAGDLTVDVKGDINLDAEGNQVRLQSNSTNNYIFNMGANKEIDVPTGNLTFDVAGNIYLDADGGSVILENADTTYASLNDSGTNLVINSGATPALKFDGTDARFLGNVNIDGDLTVDGIAVLNATLDGAGTITLGDSNIDNIIFSADVNSHVVPNTDNTYDLGSSTKEWRNLYVDGTGNIDDVQADTVTITTTLTNNGNTTLGNNASDTLTINADLTSNIRPNTTNLYSIGQSDLQWLSVWSKYVNGDSADFGNFNINGNVISNAGDITLDADGGDWFLKDNTSTQFRFTGGTNKEIDVPSGNLTVDVAGDIILNADGGDVTLADAAVTFGRFTNTSGDLIIKSGTTTAITFDGAIADFAGAIYTDSALDTNLKSVAGAINELDSDIGELVDLNTTDKSNTVAAINENERRIIDIYDSAGTLLNP